MNAPLPDKKNAPLPDNESERLAWLRESGLLDTPAEDAYDDLTRLAAQVCGVPIALITLVDEERQWFKSVVGLPVTETPRDQAFCAHAILRPDETMVVPDATQDERFRDNPLVTGQPDIRFYAGIPLVTSDGFALGSLCVIDRVARLLTDQQMIVLEVLARQVAGRIELQRSLALQAGLVARQEALLAERAQAQEEALRSEARLRLALTGGGLGTWHLDLTTFELLESSATHKAHFGLSPDARLDSAFVFRATHPEDQGSVRLAMAEAIRSRRDFRAEYRVSWPDGSVHWISSHGTPLFDEAGRPLRLIGVTQDVTESREREAERERALAEAVERADRDPLTDLWNHRAFHRRLAEEADRAGRDGTTPAVAVLDLDGFEFFNDCYGHVQGDRVLRLVAERLRAVCRPYDTVARFGGDEFALILPSAGAATAAEIETRLRADLEGLTFRPDGEGTDVPVTVSLGVSLLPPLAGDGHEALRSADERLRRVKTGGSAETEADAVRGAARGASEGFSMLDALVTAVDNKDRYTRKHSEDVMEYSLGIARGLGLGLEEQYTVSVAALLHDVGKIGVPDHILRKPGRLTDEEFEAVKQHPAMGAALVSTVPGLARTLDAVRHHHERWDGGGYPAGLKGEECPLTARLMAVADAFSAMTTDRPYRKGMPRERALAILESGAGTQWDPECVRAFRQAQKSEKTNV